MSRVADRYMSYMRPAHSVCFTLRVDYNDKDTARELKCYWSPDDKKWKKTFDMKYYPREDIHGFLRIVKRFMQTCYDNNFKIEDDEGLEDLQDAVDEDNAIIEKNIAKPVERHIPIAPGPLDAYRGSGGCPKCEKCGSIHNNGRHWCLPCYNKWENEFKNKKDTKCLIVDDE